MISVKLDLKCKPSPRPRVLKSGITYMPVEYQDFKKILALKFKGFKPFGDVPLSVEILCVFKPSKTHKRNKYPLPIGDVDQYAKTVLDALEGTLYSNDTLVQELRVKKMYGASDTIFIDIKEIE